MLIQSVVSGSGQTLVLRGPDGNFQAADWFKCIQPDCLHLIKRSYLVTKRGAENHFLHADSMLHGQPDFYVAETGHHWVCRRNFTGVHGQFSGTSALSRFVRGCVKVLSLGKCKAEIDFPGFVAYMPPVEGCPYHIISVVFRGTQSEDFQPYAGSLGASWATNYDAAPLEVDPDLYGFSGSMHSGYVTKFNYCNATRHDLNELLDNGSIVNPLTPGESAVFANPLDRSIWKTIERIPENERDQIRFIVTGHSQGAGLAQVALPYIIHRFGAALPGFIDNIETPRFFGYFLSSPRVAADGISAENYTDLVGKRNMLSHFAFRDIVTMACLRGYQTLGILACDSAFDAMYRGICSEIAYHNRLFFMHYLRTYLDASYFDSSDPNLWVHGDDSELVISWKDMKQVLAKTQAVEEFWSKGGIVRLLNDSLALYRERLRLTGDREFEEEQIQFTELIDWQFLREACTESLLPWTVELDESRREILRRVEENIYGETVTYSRSGRYNVRALVDTALDLIDAARGLPNPGGIREVFRRIFHPFSRTIEPETSFIFDKQFREILASRGIDPKACGISPAGSLSLFVYLHYGSGSNSFGTKLFDKYSPSRNIDLALRNGAIVLRGGPYNLWSEEQSEDRALEEF